MEKRELRNGNNAGPDGRKLPIKNYLVGGAGAMLFTSVCLSIIAAIYDYNFKVTLTGVEFSSNEPVEIAVLSEDEKAGLLTKDEKQLLIETLQMMKRLKKSFDKMDAADMTVGDLIGHVDNPSLHIYNRKTGELNPILSDR